MTRPKMKHEGIQQGTGAMLVLLCWRPSSIGNPASHDYVQIWNNSSQWKGWLMWADRSTPESYRALLQLPLTVLQRVLNEKGTAGEALRGSNAAHVASPQNTVAVLPQMLRYLQEPLRLEASAIVPA